VDFPISQKNRFQKKGFIAYIKCGSCDQAVRLKEVLSRYKDGKWRGKGDDRNRPALFRVKIANDSFIRAKTMDLINEHIRNREIKAKMQGKRVEAQRQAAADPNAFDNFETPARYGTVPKLIEPHKGELLYAELEGNAPPKPAQRAPTAVNRSAGRTDEVDPFSFEDMLAMCTSEDSEQRESGVELTPTELSFNEPDEQLSNSAGYTEVDASTENSSAELGHDEESPNSTSAVSSEEDWDILKPQPRQLVDKSSATSDSSEFQYSS